MINIETQYLNLLNEILVEGHDTSDRTGTGTLSLFGRQIRHNFSTGFPLLTTKKVFFRGVVEELLWILRGETNIKSLVDKNIHIWDQWADKDGELGPVYGKQWRTWEGLDHSNSIDNSCLEYSTKPRDHETFFGVKTIDQIANLIERIKMKPDCRRLIVSAWNPADIETMALPPCHCFVQFKVYGNKLNCQLYQRSADMFLGVPFNIASYALLTMMIADICGLVPGEFIHTFGDCHIYKNHIDQVKEQLSREIKPLPTLDIVEQVNDPMHYRFESFVLTGYDPHPPIKGAVSI